MMRFACFVIAKLCPKLNQSIQSRESRLAIELLKWAESFWTSLRDCRQKPEQSTTTVKKQVGGSKNLFTATNLR